MLTLSVVHQFYHEDQMRDILKEKYVPTYYMNGLLDQFLNLRQNISTVTEYMSRFEALMLWCEVDEDQSLLESIFINSLREYIKREAKVYPLFSLDVAYQKVLDYEKYLRITPRYIPFNLDTLSSLPITFLRSHPSIQPINTALPSRSTPNASSTSLAKTTTPASSSACPFTSQIECQHCHAKGYIASRCHNMPWGWFFLDENYLLWWDVHSQW